MLRTKLFLAFAALALLVAGMAAIIGFRMIQVRMGAEAQERVRLDLSSARAICASRQRELEVLVRMGASKQLVEEACVGKNWDNAEVENRLQLMRAGFGLDFLALVDADGRVVMRAAPPFAAGDFRSSDPIVAKTLRGETCSGIQVLSSIELAREADGLAERAFIPLEATSRARPLSKEAETRGLVMMAAAPVRAGATVVGALYGGILLNRNAELVDLIVTTVFQNNKYGDQPMGAATIFLDDCRVATTVKLPNGNRAIGTRASKQVADRVVDNATNWTDRAFVVNDWYLTAYEPLIDARGSVVGMLYMGTLARPLRDLERTMLLRYAALMVFGLAVAVFLAFLFAGRLAAPIRQLVHAISQMRRGGRPPPVIVKGGVRETQTMLRAFNEMAEALAEREARLKGANDQFEDANNRLVALNRSYMETLGFVSHELKTPLASIMNYVYLIKEGKAGELTDKQRKAIGTIDLSVKRIVEMVRHYLNLARIENNELRPLLGQVRVNEDVILPLLDSLGEEAAARQMRIENEISDGIVVQADVNMLLEVFENLIHNAVKYGMPGGRLWLRARERGHFMEFTVGNEGEGIMPEQLETVFQKFTRLQPAAGARPQKGTGLGLFITKHIVEAHGGRIEVASHVNEWTEFRFTLPWRKIEEQ